ncbi:kinase-like domain-containing protein [Syncephalis fuscata]|nr:kinase-like domain-containing protein [Syncephalis fuscata]
MKSRYPCSFIAVAFIAIINTHETTTHAMPHALLTAVAIKQISDLKITGLVPSPKDTLLVAKGFLNKIPVFIKCNSNLERYAAEEKTFAQLNSVKPASAEIAKYRDLIVSKLANFNLKANVPCFVLSTLVSGIDLFDFSANLIPKERIALMTDILPKILRGLAYLNEVNIAHGDIKLENILISYVDKVFRIMIIDLDHAVVCRLLKADAWSLGITIFVVLYRIYPYAFTLTPSGTTVELSQKVTIDQMQNLLKTNERTEYNQFEMLINTMDKLLTINPKDRLIPKSLI